MRPELRAAGLSCPTADALQGESGRLSVDPCALLLLPEQSPLSPGPAPMGRPTAEPPTGQSSRQLPELPRTESSFPTGWRSPQSPCSQHKSSATFSARTVRGFKRVIIAVSSTPKGCVPPETAAVGEEQERQGWLPREGSQLQRSWPLGERGEPAPPPRTAPRLGWRGWAWGAGKGSIGSLSLGLASWNNTSRAWHAR